MFDIVFIKAYVSCFQKGHMWAIFGKCLFFISSPWTSLIFLQYNIISAPNYILFVMLVSNVLNCLSVRHILLSIYDYLINSALLLSALLLNLGCSFFPDPIAFNMFCLLFLLPHLLDLLILCYLLTWLLCERTKLQ